MTILVVNISQTIGNMPIQQAATQAWKLNHERAQECDYLVAVTEGEPRAFFKVQEATEFAHEPRRVEFIIDRFCNRNEILTITEKLFNKNLSGFVTRYIE